MPGNKDTVAAIRHEVKDYLYRFPADVHEPAVSLASWFYNQIPRVQSFQLVCKER